MRRRLLLALACALTSNLAFLYKHRGACAAPAVDIRHPVRSAAGLFRSRWFAVGMLVALGAWGFHVAALALAPMSVVQAVLAGGVAFDTAEPAGPSPPAPAGTIFTLYRDQQAADEARYTIRLPYLIYFDSSISGLTTGSPVEWRGLTIGHVTSTRLEYDVAHDRLRAPVTITIEPERVSIVGDASKFDRGQMIATLVRHGLRAQVKTTNYLTGQAVVSLETNPKAPPLELGQGDIYPVIPSEPGQFDAAIASASDILDHIKALPLDKVVNQANDTLKSFQDLANAPEIQQSLHSLTAALTSAQQLIEQAKVQIQPALQKLPGLIDTAEQSIAGIRATAGSFDRGYGSASQFKRDLTRLMSQVDDAVRSIRVLSDYLEQHPESLIRGKSGGSN